jgi:hypothetical protein
MASNGEAGAGSSNGNMACNMANVGNIYLQEAPAGANGQHEAAETNVCVGTKWNMQFLNVRYVEENGVRRITEFWNVSRGQMYKIDVQAAEDNQGWWRWQHVPDESEPEYGSQQGQQAAEAQQESNQQEEEGQQATTEAHA